MGHSPILKASNDVLPLDSPLIPYERGVVVSTKLDGNRGLCVAGSLHTSSMKQPRNVRLMDLLGPLMDYAAEHGLVFDYELFSPSCTHHAELSGIINSYDNYLPDDLKAYVFDCMPFDTWEEEARDLPYSERVKLYTEHVQRLSSTGVVPLQQIPVANAREAREHFDSAILAGHEGIMLRATSIWYDPRTGKAHGGYYKHGRATNKQQNIFKAKAVNTTDGVIIGVEQRRKMRDDWPREYDSRGYLKQPLEKDAFLLDDCVGALTVTYTEKGQSCVTQISFGKGFDLETRRQLWRDYLSSPNTLIGKAVEFTYLDHGAMEGGRIRHGRLVRFRADL